jgi:hypothetical protein
VTENRKKESENDSLYYESEQLKNAFAKRKANDSSSINGKGDESGPLLTNCFNEFQSE